MDSGQYIPSIKALDLAMPKGQVVTIAPFKPSVTFYGGVNEPTLVVTHEGEFRWAKNADELIERMKGSPADQSIYYILTRLRAFEKTSQGS
ncbi:MAG: hypothetical protein M3O74_13910 [Pseudomonadota bacterium]|nr:hypothetical protein [Pseudomonadota bacterium]